MRIIAGALKGRRLKGPTGAGVRPTSDSLRETLFNVLGSRVAGARILDAFAGTGAVGLEAFSRGARAVTFVEADRAEARVLEANVAACGASEACMMVRGDFLRLAREARRPWRDREPFDLVFLDPPYDLAALDAAVEAAAALVAPGGRLVLEHAKRRQAPIAAGSLGRVRLIEAGDSALSIYQADSTP